MVSFKQKISVLKQIYSNHSNIVIFLIFFLLIYFLNAAIVQWKNLYLITTIGLSLFISGFYYSVTKTTFYTSIAVSILAALQLSILVYRSKKNINKKDFNHGFLASIAVFLGLLAPGCISCGIGFAAAIGLGAAFASLPFKGLEVAVLALLLLIYSINKTLVSFIECIVPQKRKK